MVLLKTGAGRTHRKVVHRRKKLYHNETNTLRSESKKLRVHNNYVMMCDELCFIEYSIVKKKTTRCQIKV